MVFNWCTFKYNNYITVFTVAKGDKHTTAMFTLCHHFKILSNPFGKFGIMTLLSCVSQLGTFIHE